MKQNRIAQCLSQAFACAVGSLAMVAAIAQTPAPDTLPIGGVVKQGQATIQQAAGRIDIQQSSPKVAIDWTSFSIGAQSAVNFSQPNSSA
ncbi:MAG TPA: hypothetical protein VJ001_11640, partial [Rhodocyclaceae bacterium]|nr:hypothetical protein [Rhodocyclaceae bacterium]